MGFGGLGPGEIILIFLVVLLLFGAKRLPEIGSSLGKGIREFKGSLKEIETEIKGPPEPPPSRSRTNLQVDASSTLDQTEPRRLSSTPPGSQSQEQGTPRAGDAREEEASRTES